MLHGRTVHNSARFSVPRNLYNCSRINIWWKTACRSSACLPSIAITLAQEPNLKLKLGRPTHCQQNYYGGV